MTQNSTIPPVLMFRIGRLALIIFVLVLISGSQMHSRRPAHKCLIRIVGVAFLDHNMAGRCRVEGASVIEHDA